MINNPNRTMALRGSIILAAAAGIMFFMSAPLRAAPPDFSVCDGLTGAAWGLCRGGVAAGCADGPGTEACANIEATIRNVTGNEAPWIVPPAVCPCDFTAVPISGPPWNHAIFSCPENGAAVEESPTTDFTAVVAGSVGGDPANLACLVIYWEQIPLEPYEIHENISLDEYNACRDDIIAYGMELVATVEGTTDNCTPLLVP